MAGLANQHAAFDSVTGENDEVNRILGVGLDLVELERVRTALGRHGERFVERIAGPLEIAPRTHAGQAQTVAGLFAAKEAVLKALGTGWAQGLAFRQVVVERLSSGAPKVRLEGEAGRRADRMGVAHIHLSITHDAGVAAAVAILEGPGKSPDGD